MSRWLRWAMFCAALLLLVMAPSLWVETSCGRPPDSSRGSSSFKSVLPIEDHRELVNTYLTYPEWSIVHAYEDFAAVQQQRGESAFRYADAVTGYWRNFCQVYGMATARGIVSSDVRAMLHIIGVSFTVEFAIKGAYEKTLGYLTQVWRGETPGAEDRFALKVSQGYAAFLRQTPWYEFPFADTLSRFWRETPFEKSQWLRAIERRVVLSLEWGIKSVYAKLIGWAAGVTPAPLAIRSVLDKPDAAQLARYPGITLISRTADQSVVIETPRYRAFTEILSGLAQQPNTLLEIAGNQDIFVTVLSRIDNPAQIKGGELLLRAKLQGREGWERRGLVVAVPGLLDLLRTLPAANMELEHVYDY